MSSYRSLVSSGTAAIATTDDTAVTVIDGASVTGGARGNASIINTGTVPGFFSVDGGTTWAYLPENYVAELTGIGIESGGIQIKRIASGDNMTGVYAFAW